MDRCKVLHSFCEVERGWRHGRSKCFNEFDGFADPRGGSVVPAVLGLLQEAREGNGSLGMAEHGVWPVRFAERLEFACIQFDV
jgi:hypothetical protein